MRELFDTRRREDGGLTMMELLASVVIFGLLAAIAVPIYINQKKSAYDAQIRSMLESSAIVLKQERTAANGRYPEMLPADIVIPDGASVVYTRTADRSEYCLAVTQGSIKLFANGKSNGEHKISNIDCTYSQSGPSTPLISGDISVSNEPILSWAAVSGAKRYEITQDGAVVATVDKTNWRGTALNSASEFSMRAIDSTGNASAKSNTITLRPSKSQPTNAPVLSLLNVSGDNAQRTGTLTWSTVLWAEEYRVINASNSAVLWSGQGNTMQISASIGQVLTVYVVAANDIGVSPQSNSVTLEGPLPTSPTLSASTTQATNGVTATLSWSAVPGATAYNLYKNGTKIKSNAVSGVTDLTAWNKGNITYLVKPVTADGREGTPSNNVVVATTQPIPAVPVWVNLTLNKGTGVATATWNAVTYANSYVVEFQRNGGAWTKANATGTTTTIPSVAAGQTLNVRLYSVGYTGQSAASAIRSVSNDMPTPVLSNHYTTPTYSSVTGTCSAGTPRYRMRDDSKQAAGTWRAWTPWREAGLGFGYADHPSDWGQRTNVQWEVECYDSVSGAVSSVKAKWNPTLGVLEVPMPGANNWEFADAGWNGSYVVLQTRLVVNTACVPGTQMQGQYRDKMLEWSTWNAWSGWVNSPTTDRSAWFNSGLPWGTTAQVQISLRCIAPNGTVSAINGVHGPANRTASIPAAWSPWVGITAWRVAGWGAGCVSGTTPRYYFHKDGARPVDYGWTFETSYNGTNHAWGNGGMWVAVECQSGSYLGPQVRGYGGF